MLLDDYLNGIRSVLAEIVPLLVNHSLTIDKRPQEQAHYLGCVFYR